MKASAEVSLVNFGIENTVAPIMATRIVTTSQRARIILAIIDPFLLIDFIVDLPISKTHPIIYSNCG